MIKLFSKTCELCKEKATNPIEKIVPVYGYTLSQKRYFCSREHADTYEKQIKEFMKTHKPSSRSCCG